MKLHCTSTRHTKAGTFRAGSVYDTKDLTELQSQAVAALQADKSINPFKKVSDKEAAKLQSGKLPKRDLPSRSSSADNSALSKDLDAAKVENAKLTSDLDAAKDENAKVTSDLEAAKDEIEKLKADLEAAKSEPVQQAAPTSTKSQKVD